MNQQEANLALFTMGQDGLDDERPANDVPDPLSKFLSDAELAATLGRDGHNRVANFQTETAELDSRFSHVYQIIAKKAEAETLAKSAAAPEWNEPLSGEKGVRIEKTRYPSGAVVCAEIKDGVVVRTYRES